jgi:hypothetical protein
MYLLGRSPYTLTITSDCIGVYRVRSQAILADIRKRYELANEICKTTSLYVVLSYVNPFVILLTL